MGDVGYEILSHLFEASNIGDFVKHEYSPNGAGSSLYFCSIGTVPRQ